MNKFCVRRKGDSYAPSGYEILEADTNLYTGEKDFRKVFGKPTSLESDLLLLASAIFAADRASPRGANEDISRNFILDVPVANLGRFLPVVGAIEGVLRRLSQDGWEIKFRATGGELENSFTLPAKSGRTLLFSGGLDSLAAAVEFGNGTEVLGLVSHKTRNPVTENAQHELAALLTANGYKVDHRQFFVSSKDGGPTDLAHDLESSQRTRSFVFLTLGAIAARRTGRYDIVYLAENGQMAIHLPLTHGRVGAFSTHTAHPDVLQGMSGILTHVLSAPISITNPYVAKTKREVVELVLNKLPASVPIATSCWRNARMTGKARHCGICVPCYVRRIAIEAIALDPTKYARDPWKEDLAKLDESDDALRNLVDLVEFVKRFETSLDADLMSEFPELHSENIQGPDVIAMYRRFAGEARGVLSKYKPVKPLLA